MESTTFKVTLNSYEDLVQFERKCFREGEGVLFNGVQRPRVFPCEMDVEKYVTRRLLPPDFFEHEEQIMYSVFYVTKL
ncbi:hypothetical protein SJC25_39 [Bacteroides phage SJC25]|nr:hypothetical protein SJC25_39 [Bacteroides phage SJC25]